MAATAQPIRQVDFSHWMAQAASRIDTVLPELAPDPVHDLRVALRRCRSIASSFRMIDFHPAWRRMDRAARSLFRQFGELRDVQVLAEWVAKLGDEKDPVRVALLTHCALRETALRTTVTVALQRFNRQRWVYWSELLAQRVQRVPVDGDVFQAVALHRYRDAHELHQKALKNRTKVAYHELRIGLKKFRYVVENFLPARHRQWGAALKRLQDLLGEVHDLDVLWLTALKQKVFRDTEARERWRERVETERAARIALYRELMVGPNSLWQAWRRGLPPSSEVRRVEHERLKTWAAFLDADTVHSARVERLASQLANGLVQMDIYPPRQRLLEHVRAAAILHGVGGSPKKSRKLISRLVPPSGWLAEELELVAIAARYYRGSLPSTQQKRFAALSESEKQAVRQIAAVLRLADALDRDHSGSVKRVSLHRTKNVLIVKAIGFRNDGPNAQAVAAGRFLMETICAVPVIVRGANADQRVVSSRASTR
jgi:CHAD domain-containing protein